MASDSHAQEFDFSQITEHLFIGSNLCCADKSHFQFLIEAGISAEIDLEKERQDAPPEISINLWLPVKDKAAPTQDQLAAGAALIAALVKNKKKVYVHCKYGHGRSPTLVAAYLISQGLSLQKAIQKIKSARPEIHLEPVQLRALKKFSQ